MNRAKQASRDVENNSDLVSIIMILWVESFAPNMWGEMTWATNIKYSHGGEILDNTFPPLSL